MRKILLTGKNGQVGWELRRTLAPLGDVVAVGHREMDLADPDSIRNVMRQTGPDIVVNTAAYTAVDRAESEPDLAMAVNGTAPGIMAEEAKRINATIVHFSTDYVFDGTKAVPYREEDAPNPLNVYGSTKLAGERAVMAAGAPYLILRTGWVYGARGRNFLLTMLKLFNERDELKVVDDQQGSPTWCRMLAEVTSQMLARRYSPGAPASDGFSGLYHVVSGGMTTWYGFARKILEKRPRASGKTAPALVPIVTADYPRPASRPRNSRLSCDKLTDTYGLSMPSWEASLSMCIDEMASHSLSS